VRAAITDKIMINKENTTTSISRNFSLNSFQLRPISRTKYSFHRMFSKIEKEDFCEDIKMSFIGSVGRCGLVDP
jgi:hypothetical protein